MKTKRYIAMSVMLVTLIIASMVLLGGCTKDNSNKDAHANLQQQLDTLSATLSALKVDELRTSTAQSLDALTTKFNNVASQLATVSTLSSLPQTVSTLKAQVDTLSNSLETVKGQVATAAPNATNLANLTKAVDSLKTTVTTIQQAMSAYSVVIGATPVNINGLSVTFLSSSTLLAGVSTSSPATIQLSVKIANNTGSNIGNLDIIGALTLSQYTASYAAGYPALTDVAGSVNYVSYYNGSNVVNFEVYSQSTPGPKGTVITTNLSIPNGSSITLRPCLKLLATGYALPATVVTLTLSTIVYDKTG